MRLAGKSHLITAPSLIMPVMRISCLGGEGTGRAKPLACLRLKLNHRVAFKWVCWVIKVDKMLLLSPSAHLRLVGNEMSDVCWTFWKRTDHYWDSASTLISLLLCCFADYNSGNYINLRLHLPDFFLSLSCSQIFTFIHKITSSVSTFLSKQLQVLNLGVW